MIVVISPEHGVIDEHVLIGKMFEKQLDLFHIRKYSFDGKQMREYIGRLPKDFRSRLVLHSHYNLADEFGIGRVHIRENDRLKKQYIMKDSKFVLSTSTHSIEDFNQLDERFDYAFLSPVFSSISKPRYGTEKNVYEALLRGNNSEVLLLGLGGIDETNIHEVLKKGVDGVALMGGIWQSADPLKSFLRCREAEQMY